MLFIEAKRRTGSALFFYSYDACVFWYNTHRTMSKRTNFLDKAEHEKIVSHPVVVGVKPRHTKGLKLPVIVLLGGLILGVIAYGVWYTYTNNRQSEPQPKITNAAQAADVYTQAANIAATQNADKAYSYYDAQLDTATNDSARQSLLIGKASLELNNQQYDAALSTAQAADTIKRTGATVKLLGMIYEGIGNKADALKYYKLALDLLPENTENSSEKDMVQYKIDELQQT